MSWGIVVSDYQYMRDKNILHRMETIRLHPAYKSLPDEILSKLAKKFHIIHFAKGEYIFHQDDPSDNMYIIESGRVIVEKNASSGKTFTFVVAVRGVTLNAVTCFKKSPRFLSARAVEKTTILTTSCHDFSSWVIEHPEVTVETINILGTLLDGAYNRIIDLIDESAEQRILNALMMLFSRLGKNLPFTNMELADMTGTSRETAARVISRLQSANLLSKSRSQIEITDPDKLIELAGNHVFLV
ncbi:MAG: Crp/Fnr family transcriptional regulator [Bacteroidetes bacterium]|nr:Crp/Fnr family transcriptional regulator [Bacteroidota bacterium]